MTERQIVLALEALAARLSAEADPERVVTLAREYADLLTLLRHRVTPHPPKNGKAE